MSESEIESSNVMIEQGFAGYLVVFGIIAAFITTDTASRQESIRENFTEEGTNLGLLQDIAAKLPNIVGVKRDALVILLKEYRDIVVNYELSYIRKGKTFKFDTGVGYQKYYGSEKAVNKLKEIDEAIDDLIADAVTDPYIDNIFRRMTSLYEDIKSNRHRRIFAEAKMLPWYMTLIFVIGVVIACVYPLFLRGSLKIKFAISATVLVSFLMLIVTYFLFLHPYRGPIGISKDDYPR